MSNDKRNDYREVGDSAVPQFRWEDIDHTLVALKRTALAEEIHEKTKKNERRIYFENRNNFNDCAIPTLILEMKEQSTDECVQKTYQIYCDVWRTQGGTKSGIFVRAVYNRALIQVISARTGSIAHDFERFVTRTNFSRRLARAYLESFRQRMDRLKDRWGRQLEAEARECELVERRASLDRFHPSVVSIPTQHLSSPTTTNQQSSTKPPVPLSEFEAMVGKLMVEARSACQTKYLRQAEIMKIGALLDDKNVPVRSNLEREAGRSMAEYNKQHPGAAIKSWRTALGRPKFRSAVRKRFSRAEEKYKRSIQLVVGKSAGTSRTTI